MRHEDSCRSKSAYHSQNCHSDRSFSFPPGNEKRSGGTCFSRFTKGAVGLPLFPVRKSVGEPEHAVMRGTGASPRPPCGTEGLALRRYSFQRFTRVKEMNGMSVGGDLYQSETSLKRGRNTSSWFLRSPRLLIASARTRSPPNGKDNQAGRRHRNRCQDAFHQFTPA